jgi:hypothetical protein
LWAPRLDEGEALLRETRYFFECVASVDAPFNDGRAGLRVVKILEAADRSLVWQRGRIDAARQSPSRPVGRQPVVALTR